MISPTKVVVVYNTTAAGNLSETVANYYCAARGIPLANKIGYAFGTSNAYNINANTPFWDFLTTLAALYASLGAEAVVLSAFSPGKFTCYGGTGVYSNDVSSANFLGFAPWFVAFGAVPDVTARCGNIGGFYPLPCEFYNPKTFGSADPVGAEKMLVQSSHTAGEPLTGWYEFSELPLVENWKGNPWFVPHGKIGRLSSASDNETECYRIIDDAVANEKTYVQVQNTGCTIHVGAGTRNAGSSKDIVQIYANQSINLLASQGFDKGTHVLSTCRGGVEAWSIPYPGDDYLYTDMMLGNVFTNDCWGLVGSALTNENSSDPLFGSFNFLPGAWSYTATSLGSVADAVILYGGCSGVGSVSEPLSGTIPNIYLFTKNVLRGKTMAEANLVSMSYGGMYVTAYGDPLYAPFGAQFGATVMDKTFSDAYLARPSGYSIDGTEILGIRGKNSDPFDYGVTAQELADYSTGTQDSIVASFCMFPESEGGSVSAAFQKGGFTLDHITGAVTNGYWSGGLFITDGTSRTGSTFDIGTKACWWVVTHTKNASGRIVQYKAGGTHPTIQMRPSVASVFNSLGTEVALTAIGTGFFDTSAKQTWIAELTEPRNGFRTFTVYFRGLVASRVVLASSYNDLGTDFILGGLTNSDIAVSVYVADTTPKEKIMQAVSLVLNRRSKVDKWNGYYPLWSGLALDYTGYVRNDTSLLVFDPFVGTQDVKITDQTPPLGTKWTALSGSASQMIFATGGTSLVLAPGFTSYSASALPHSIDTNPKRVAMTFFVNPFDVAKWSAAGVFVRGSKSNSSVIYASCIRGLTDWSSCHLEINEWDGASLTFLGSLQLTGYDHNSSGIGQHTLVVEDNGVDTVRCYLADYPAQVLSVNTTDLAVETRCGIYFDDTGLDLLGSTRTGDQTRTRVSAYYCMQIPTF